MAFVAGALIGGLIGAAIVRAYDVGLLNNLKAQVNDTINTLNVTIAMQKNIINALKYKIKIYESRHGKINEEESECN